MVSAHLRRNLQLLPLPNEMTLGDSLLKLPHDLLIQRRRRSDSHLYLSSRRAHQHRKLLANTRKHAQSVVFRERIQEVLERVALVLHACVLLELGRDLLFVGCAERRRRENCLEVRIGFEALVEVVEGFGDVV